MKHSLIVLLLIASTHLNVFAQDVRLKFSDKGTFKIAQFTDLHWSHKSPDYAKTVQLMRYILDTEKPDVAILTGDIVTDSPARDAWDVIAGVFLDAKTPWGITLGNHDSETDLSKSRIFDYLKNKPYFIGEKGPDEIHGNGNYVLPVSGSGNKIAALLYCFDSNHYPPVKKYGNYDCIHYDQIEWYRKQSESFTIQNSGIPLPALAFFHIPLTEYRNVIDRSTTIGNRGRFVASSDVNSGLLSSFLDKKDVMGTFVGHDHSNDYIGVEHDIALAYGRTTGVDASGRLEKGARIIQLYENKFKFDTWIRTQNGIEFEYHFPSSFLPQDEKPVSYLPAKKTSFSRQGVSYSYYEGRYKTTDEIEKDKPEKQGIINNISIENHAVQDSFAYVFKTWIRIPETGMYNFYTFSDDGSKLFIDGQVVVDNDGSHSARRADGKIALEEGFHELKLLYLENYMGQVLEVGFSSSEIRESVLPDHMLFIE